MANVIRERGLAEDIELVAEKDRVVLKAQDEYAFASGKGLVMKVRIGQVGVQRVIEEKERCRRE